MVIFDWKYTILGRKYIFLVIRFKSWKIDSQVGWDAGRMNDIKPL